MRFVCLLAVSLMFSGLTSGAIARDGRLAQALPPPDAEMLSRQPTRQIIDRIETKHPATYFLLAKRLFVEGEREEAVFWFYLGQIRYRSYLKLNPKLDPSGDPALFSSLFEVVGRPINVYAFGDIPKLIDTIDRALEWDGSHADTYAPKASPDRNQIVNGLRALKVSILAQQDEIRASRTAKGLENRK